LSKVELVVPIAVRADLAAVRRWGFGPAWLRSKALVD
jgi:hypothetical protein